MLKTYTQRIDKPLKREIELDFLRGVAILMVLDFHAKANWLFMPFHIFGIENFGWAGVNLFFILSGFLVGGLLIREWQIDDKIEAGRFLIRRAFKIWPQYYVYLGIMILVGHRSIKQLWGNILNIQNYVSGSIAHTWSLAVEEQAYLLLSIILIIAVRNKMKIKRVFYIFLTLSLIVFMSRLILSGLGFDVYYATHTRMDGILNGVLLAILFHHKNDAFISLQKKTWVWITCLGIAITFFWIHPKGWWSNPVRIDMGNLLSLALLMLVYHPKKSTRSFIYRFVAWIGIYSYGIYLWHVASGDLLSRLVHCLNLHFSWLFAPIQYPGLKFLQLLMAVGIGVFFTRLVEIPCIQVREKLFPRRIDSAVAIDLPKKRAVDSLGD
jgi:peptidoglycan/LPS O-acetylase OafA/YrhL